MWRQFASFVVAGILSFCVVTAASAQDVIAIGGIEHVDGDEAIIVGVSDALPDQSFFSVVEIVDASGVVDYGLMQMHPDGSFAMSAPSFLTQTSTLVFANVVEQNDVTDSIVIFLAENLKKLPDNELALIDPHAFKEDVVPGHGGEYNIYWDTSEPDKDKRKIKLVKISDTSVIVDSEETWGDVKDAFPADDE